MGLDYSFRVNIKREQLAESLIAVARFAHANSEEKIDVYLPERKLSLPFTSRFKTFPLLVHSSTDTLEFDTSLLFPVSDEAMEKYVRETEQHLQKRENSSNWLMPRDEE